MSGCVCVCARAETVFDDSQNHGIYWHGVMVSRILGLSISISISISKSFSKTQCPHDMS